MSQFELAVATVLFFPVFLRLALITVVGLLIIRPVRDCLACFCPAVPIRMRWLVRFNSAFEWRWCADCGWEGPARKALDGDARTADSFLYSE